MSEAAGYQLDRTQQEIVLRVIRFYYEVLLVNRKLDVSEQSAKTALSIKDRSQVRFDSGLVVESDLLAAQVRLAARQQEVIQERNNVEMARAQLNTAMGMPVASSFRFPEVLAERALPVAGLEDLEKLALVKRPDLKRVAAEEAAQHQSVAIAKSSFGPRVNAFASWELDNPTFAAGGGGSNWMGGIEMQFDIFQGGAKRAELFRQRALEDKIAALKQTASDAVRLEVRRAYYDVDASRQQIEVSRPGESHPEALAELYVSLSTHTAPIMEPRRAPICQ
jgi:outer membrane protein TolC